MVVDKSHSAFPMPVQQSSSSVRGTDGKLNGDNDAALSARHSDLHSLRIKLRRLQRALERRFVIERKHC